MSKEIGVLILHGMGSQKSEYADPMIAEIESRLLNEGKDVEKIAWEPVYWANAIEENELAYLDAVKQQNHKMDYMPLRKFIVKALGDAVAYQNLESDANTTYGDVNSIVKESMQKLYDQLGSEDKPLIVMAHSLGGHVMSNYIWDTRKDDTVSGFRNFDSLKRIITFGCNLPLFSFAYATPVAIETPVDCEWFNYYDKDDVLGYPLKPISDSYKEAVKEDVEINVGNVLTSWQPLSHDAYWTDNDFTKAVQKHLSDFL